MFFVRMRAATSEDVAPAATTMGSAIMISEARMPYAIAFFVAW